MDITRLLSKALTLHQEGKLSDAEKLYMRVLELCPQHADALHHLGLVHLQQGLVPQAVVEIQASLKADPLQPAALINLGHCLQLVGDFQGACSSCEAAIAMDPTDEAAWVNLGNAQRGMGLHESARLSYTRAHALNPENPYHHYNIGLTYSDQEDPQKASNCFVRCLEKYPGFVEARNNLTACLIKLKRPQEALHHATVAVECRPDYAEAWSNMARALDDLGQLEEALAAHRRVTELIPTSAESWINFGTALSAQKQYVKALACFERAVTLDPSLSLAWTNLGSAQHALRRLEQALESHKRSIELNAASEESWYNQGNTLRDLGLMKDALKSFEMALRLKETYYQAWNNRGVVLQYLGNYEESFSSYAKAVELAPNYEEARYNSALLSLLQKNFEQGFKDYLWRPKSENFRHVLDQNLGPLSIGETEGQALLLIREQGIGDEIFYANFLGQMLGKFSRICLTTDKRLRPVFSRSFPEITLLDDTVLESETNLMRFDRKVCIGDLGVLLGITENEVREIRKPYIETDKRRTSGYRSNLVSANKIVCGLSWQSVNEEFGREKTISLTDLEPILRHPGLEFVNLQYGKVSAELEMVQSRYGVTIREIEGLDLHNDIDGLLSLIAACDIVITTSNLTAHLTGSIGKKGCVLLPKSKGRMWFWHLGEKQSLWYPSLTLFQQTESGTWADPIENIKDWIETQA